MIMHYCEIFSDCYHCPAPFCPYEKLDTDGWDTQGPEDDGDDSGDEEMQD